LKTGAVLEGAVAVVDSDGVAVAYDVSRGRRATPVAFVEGWSYGRWMWHWQRTDLAEYTTIVPDNRGTGDSEAPGLGMPGLLGRVPERLRQPLIYLLHRETYSIRRMAADLETVLADVGAERVHLVGASMGGMIALTHAVEYDRAASLSLLCTTAGGDMADLIPEETTEHLAATPAGLNERERLRYRMEPATTAAWREAQPETVEQIVDWRVEQDAPVAVREAQAVGQLGFDLRDRLGEVQVPTVVMHGTADEVVPVERGRELAAGLGRDLETVEGGSHLFFLERPATVNDRLRELFEGA
jgi:pimeloyl-ACP methyl ester carboxylesterase